MKQKNLVFIVLAVLVFLWFKKSQPASSGGGASNTPLQQSSGSGSGSGSTTVRFQPYPNQQPAATQPAATNIVASPRPPVIDTVYRPTLTTTAVATSPLRTALADKYELLNSRQRYSI